MTYNHFCLLFEESYNKNWCIHPILNSLCIILSLVLPSFNISSGIVSYRSRLVSVSSRVWSNPIWRPHWLLITWLLGFAMPLSRLPGYPCLYNWYNRNAVSLSCSGMIAAQLLEAHPYFHVFPTPSHIWISSPTPCSIFLIRAPSCTFDFYRPRGTPPLLHV